ncbi:MAG: hypothetical protein CMF49_06185 [Legionellales bacterium]|nr:hypothetical protein [Legionellales bacterium]|tara:strand:- start:61 stop:309 length:249 start_codon:yes stop_codon:yes gene_type:complete
MTTLEHFALVTIYFIAIENNRSLGRFKKQTKPEEKESSGVLYDTLCLTIKQVNFVFELAAICVGYYMTYKWVLIPLNHYFSS